jgi:hypothetical protein
MATVVTGTAAGMPVPAQGAGGEEQQDAPATPIIKKDNNISLNPGAVLGLGVLEYTRGFGGVVSVGVSGLYFAPLLYDLSVVGGGVSLLFWLRHPNNGGFAGLKSLAGWSYDHDSLGAGWRSGVASVRAVVGWRWLWENGFNVGFGCGAEYAFMVHGEDVVNCSDDLLDPLCLEVKGGQVVRFEPVLVFDLGFAW